MRNLYAILVVGAFIVRHAGRVTIEWRAAGSVSDETIRVSTFDLGRRQEAVTVAQGVAGGFYVLGDL